MGIPFVGPSYNLRSRTADVQRTINMIPIPLEPGNERSVWRFQDLEGLVPFCDFGVAMRGCENVNGRCFVVAGGNLYELNSDGTFLSRAVLNTVSGRVGITFNTTQLVISDGAYLYVMILATNVMTRTPFMGKARIDYINQYIVFIIRESQQFGWTNIGDASTIDDLSFASAESSPDSLVGLIVDHRELLLLGSDSVEDWLNTGSTSIFERNQGVAIENGAASEWSIQKLDGSVYWLTSSTRGQGSVIRLQGYQPVTISTAAIESRFSGLDLSGATAYTYENEKSAFYCLNVPGLDTTLVYDTFSQQWHERAEWVNGSLQPHRGTMHLFAFGYHMLGSDSGRLYRLDPNVSGNDGDPLIRERIMPTVATPLRDRSKVNRFVLDCDRGTGGRVQMRYSIDGGRNWAEWRTRSLGAAGVFNRSVQFKRLNGGKDLVVQVRCTDNVPFNPISGTAG